MSDKFYQVWDENGQHPDDIDTTVSYNLPSVTGKANQLRHCDVPSLDVWQYTRRPASDRRVARRTTCRIPGLGASSVHSTQRKA